MELPLVCVVLTGCTVDEMLKDASLATAAGADLVEVRLDKLWTREVEMEESEEDGDSKKSPRREIEYQVQPLDSVDLKSALSSFKQGIELPVILTCRPERQGGYYPGDESSRIEVLRTAIESEVSWVDLEVDIAASDRKSLMEKASGKTKIIASHHSEENPPPASEIVAEVEDYSSHGDMVKMCYPISGFEGALRVFEAAWELRGSEIEMSMMGVGSGGDWSRIHAPLLNQKMVYSTMQVGWHLSHSGKINVSDLTTAWKLLGYSS
ncbi:MAG: hypothetical protein CMA62_04460 [Euryarchaeota archaeon]|nr:hypothetical protein [Euryarchaeota archaeon]DAC46815.1 MAG TPA: type I 3-dehydroquinate dehydratase [Candidatus Poseidoniales archaeon]HII33873.1 type I 3-dehydroquinate dehydratase [Candidatus Thalassarchaeaceae archaeon]